jgi:hypothetical protein
MFICSLKFLKVVWHILTLLVRHLIWVTIYKRYDISSFNKNEELLLENFIALKPIYRSSAKTGKNLKAFSSTVSIYYDLLY